MLFWPQSIMGRTVLIMSAVLVVSHLIALGVYSGDRYSVMAASRGKQNAERITKIVLQMEEAPPQQRAGLASTLSRPSMFVAWSSTTPLVDQDGKGLWERLARSSLLGNLEGISPDRVRVMINDDLPLQMWRGMRHHDTDRRPGGPSLQISLRLGDGGWVDFITPFQRLGGFWSSRFFLTILLTTAAAMALSIFAVRRATLPLALFARAAERLGLDVNAPPLHEDGPREVQQASHAFNEMQNRLRVFVRDRTHMLAAISHDLRTPITRLKLRAEFIDDQEQRNKMLADLDEMEKMIAATLSFAKDDAAAEPPMTLDLAALLQSLCDDLTDAGHEATYSGAGKAAIKARPLALKRAFGNLIGNAIQYGGRARVNLEMDGNFVNVTVDDDGQGIPASELERVFAPFHRLENSRSRETGGVGLGLASARTQIRAHGGDIRLGNRADGGLRATVTLPIKD